MKGKPGNKSATENIRKELENYIGKYSIKSLVLGLSGGIDSTLCAVLARPVCTKLGVPLIGRSITIETNKPDEIQRSIAAGASFCTDFREVDLTALYKSAASAIEELPLEDMTEKNTRIRFGNIKARIRMIYLYNLAQKHRGMVLSTDNYTEYLLGFWTLHGDVGDYGMIQNLWKTEIYELAAWLIENELKSETEKKALRDCIEAVPTDGLGITGSDLDQLEAGSYTEVDSILMGFLADGKFKDHSVVRRHHASEFKRNNPFNIPRDRII
ncbi:MAG: NAD(+) synthase [Bacteroidetes bacterium]|nr:NAD(+) synthase [Bacteroidota bacterium]